MQLETLDIGQEKPQNNFEQTLEKSYTKLIEKLTQILNGGLKFSDNFDCLIKTITTNATPGVTTAITHGLKRIPFGIVMEKDKAAHVYLASKDANTYNVASDVASVTVTLLIF